MDDIASFGLWLKLRRTVLELTQAELARLVGCAEVTIRKIEADERRPSPQIAERLALSLELAPNERVSFLKVARADLAAFRLASPAQAGALVARRSALPLPRTPLIGRDQEVTAVCALLRRADVGLVTLTGPGGTGKTRLALQAATDLAPAFADGVVFVDLAPIRDPELVPAAIAQALTVTEVSGQSLMQFLQAALCRQQILLLLDNFEQVIAAAPLVADLLAAAPRLKVLLTSRVVVGVYGEYLFDVPPLHYPEPGHPPGRLRVRQLVEYAAIRMFADRAQAMKADFVVTDDNAAAVVGICQRLEGLPLAIELAAARIRVLPPERLLERLEQRLPLLTDGARSLPIRQQTLRATIDWSYNLLDAPDQRLIQRLAQFVSGCTVEAAEAVCTALDNRNEDVVVGLASLVNQSLVRQVEDREGEPRFSLFETIREYALECLTASGELEMIRRVHAEHYLRLAEAAERELQQGSAQVTWLERLEVEHDNLRAALLWAHEQHETEIIARLATALQEFWIRRGYLSEGRRWLEAALAAGAHGPALAPALWTKAMLATAAVAHHQGDYKHGTALCEQALALSQAHGDKTEIAAALAGLALSRMKQSDYRGAAELLERQLALERELGNRRRIAGALGSLGYLTCDQGNAERGFALLKESLKLQRELGHKPAIAWALHALGVASYHQAEFQQSIGWCEDGLALFQELGDVACFATMLIHLGSIAGYQGDPERAARLLQDGLDLFHKLGNRDSIAVTLRYQGKVAHDQGNWKGATELYRESLALAHEIGRQWEIAACLEGLAGVASGRCQPRRAARLWGAATELRERLSAPLPPAGRSEYEAAVAYTRATLGDQAFDAAWAEGRTTPLEQTIAYALEQDS